MERSRRRKSAPNAFYPVLAPTDVGGYATDEMPSLNPVVGHMHPRLMNSPRELDVIIAVGRPERHLVRWNFPLAKELHPNHEADRVAIEFGACPVIHGIHTKSRNPAKTIPSEPDS